MGEAGMTDCEARTMTDPIAEWDDLAAALNRWGIRHVAPGDGEEIAAVAAARELFERLAHASDPRLHQAAVVVLLTHPDTATEARAAIDRLAGRERDRAMRRYVAAAALQRMARTRIALALGPQPSIPAAYLDELGLPPLDAEFGRATLLALAEQEGALYGFDAWGTYVALLDHFLHDIQRSGWGKPCESERIGSD